MQPAVIPVLLVCGHRIIAKACNNNLEAIAGINKTASGSSGSAISAKTTFCLLPVSLRSDITLPCLIVLFCGISLYVLPNREQKFDAVHKWLL